MENNSGYLLLRNPHTNKDTAFTLEERRLSNIEGLLPEKIETIDTQVQRIQDQLKQIELPIHKYSYLSNLHDINQTLYFKIISSEPATFLPIVYTPTVGEACQKFGHVSRRPRGLFISINHKGRIKEILKNWPVKDVRFIVVTDGGRILGLGDLGINGMGIPIGKLALYTACAGVPPECTLPIILDVGTNNEEYLLDPLYLGLKQKRIEGKEYDEFIEEFVIAVNELYPKVCIQWEDFNGKIAISILNKYYEKVCTYNDDIQGTAAVATAGIITSNRFSGKPFTEEKILFLGAGAAAFGIADMLVNKFIRDGLTKQKAYERVWMFDVNGLLVKSRTDLVEYQMPFAHESEPSNDFAATILKVKPTAIIGVSTVGGSFTQQVIENMSTVNERPIIFPYSNPSSHSECTAEQAYTWSNGKAIFASGSPFAPVTYNGKTYTSGQGNNVFIFPALGLAVYATEAKRVTDEMFVTAAEAVAEQVTDEDFANGLIYPKVDNILEVSFNVALKIAEKIFELGLAGVEKPRDLKEFVKSKMYKPDY